MKCLNIIIHNHCVQECLQPKASKRKEWALKHCNIPSGQGHNGTKTQCVVGCDLLAMKASSKSV